MEEYLSKRPFSSQIENEHLMNIFLAIEHIEGKCLAAGINFGEGLKDMSDFNLIETKEYILMEIKMYLDSKR